VAEGREETANFLQTRDKCRTDLEVLLGAGGKGVFAEDSWGEAGVRCNLGKVAWIGAGYAHTCHQ
jgi:hypothetical protein